MIIRKIEDLKDGDFVDIIYTTYMNNTPKRRNLTRLRFGGFTSDKKSACYFVQMTKKQRSYIINVEDIKVIFRVTNLKELEDTNN